MRESDYEQALAALLDLRTPESVLEALARGTRFGNESQFLVHEAIRKALPVHEHGEALWERYTTAYRDALRAAARHLHTLTPAPPYSVGETADLLWFWFGPSGWRTHVVRTAPRGTARRPSSCAPRSPHCAETAPSST